MSVEPGPTPPALHQAAELWEAAGRPPQSTRWSARAWVTAFPEHAEYLDTLPNPIGRTAVTERCRDADQSLDAAVRGFLAAMVWGYGPVGYGPYRTARVLSENPDAAQTLREVAGRARTEGGPAAFNWLASHRLRWLGVAFATKYLFFCAGSGTGAPAPVLDRLVRGWLARHTGWRPRLDWQSGDYRSYVATVTAWAVELGLTPADTEYLIFADASGVASRWLPALGSNSEPGLPDGFDVGDERAVLDALDDAAEAFDALPPSDDPLEADDFDYGLRQLRRLVLARGRASHTLPADA